MEQLGSARRPPLHLTVVRQQSDTGTASNPTPALSSTTDVECGSTGGTPRANRSGQQSFSQQVPGVMARVVTAYEVTDSLRSSPPKVLRQSSHPVLLVDSQSGVLSRKSTGDSQHRIRIHTEDALHQVASTSSGSSYPRVMAIGQRSIEKLYDTVDWEDPPPGMLSPRSSEGVSRHCSCTSLTGSGSAHLRVGGSCVHSGYRGCTVEGCGTHGASRERLVAELAARVLEDIEARQANQVAHMESKTALPLAATTWPRPGAATVPAPTSIARLQPCPPDRIVSGRVLHRPAQVAFPHTAPMATSHPGVCAQQAPLVTSGTQVPNPPPQQNPSTRLPEAYLPPPGTITPTSQCSPSMCQAVDLAPTTSQIVVLTAQETEDVYSTCQAPPCEEPCETAQADLSAELLSEEASDEMSTAAPTLSATSVPTLSATSQPQTCTIIATEPTSIGTFGGPPHPVIKASVCSPPTRHESGSGRHGGTGAAPTPSATATPREANVEPHALLPVEDTTDTTSSGEVAVSSTNTPSITHCSTIGKSLNGRRSRRAITLAERWVANYAACPASVRQMTYPSGISVDLAQLADGFVVCPSPGGGDTNAPGTPVELRHAQTAWALENGSIAETALQAYKAFDPEMKGFLAWGGGTIQEFIGAAFRRNELVPPPDAQVYRAYMLFTNGSLGAPLDARECVCLVDALVRSELLRRECGRLDFAAPPSSHSGSPLMNGTPASLVGDSGMVTFAGYSEVPPRDSSVDDVGPREMLPLDVEQWAPEDVGRWAVEELGLPEELGELLVHEEIHGPVLLSLQEEDLERLNVAPFGRRRQLYLGICELLRQQFAANEQHSTVQQWGMDRQNAQWFAASPRDAPALVSRNQCRARAHVSHPEPELRAVFTPSVPSASSTPGFAKQLRPGPGRVLHTPASHVSREVSSGGLLQPNMTVQPLVRVLPPRKFEQTPSARFVTAPVARQSSWQHRAAGPNTTAVLSSGTLVSAPPLPQRVRTPSPPPRHQAVTAGSQSPRIGTPVLNAVPSGQLVVVPPQLALPTSGGSACVPPCLSSRAASPPVPHPFRGASMHLPAFTATRTTKGETLATAMSPGASPTRLSPWAVSGMLSPRQ